MTNPKDTVRDSHMTIRGVDKKLYKQARIQAINEGKPVGQWLNEAIKEKLSKTPKK